MGITPMTPQSDYGVNEGFYTETPFHFWVLRCDEVNGFRWEDTGPVTG